jgi:uncharacterized protein YecE (DUF72 family)
MAGTVLVGTQGWSYPAWVGPFYPPGTRTADMLRVYARGFRTVEVDATFYATPAEPVVHSWARRVPGGFSLSLKVPQEVTHERRLVDAAAPLEKFVARARLLGAALGPLLLQMPPDWTPGAAARDALAAFLPILPRDLRWAIEFRDPGWLNDATVALLAEHHVALALADGRWLKRERVLALAAEPTADFAYVRWLGPDRRLVDYSRVQVNRDLELALWADALVALRRRVRMVYAYFNNHFEGHAPASARAMQAMLGETPVDPARLRGQGELF